MPLRVISYAGVKDLPIVSPHGHTDPRWYALNEPFPDPAQLLIVPDHYVFRMLFSQGVRLEDLGVPTVDGSPVETDGREDLAALRRAFLSVSRHADAAVVRLCAVGRVRHRRAADGGQCRCALRQHRRKPRHRCLPPARIVRALQHRGDRDDGRRARRSALAQGDPRQRLVGQGRHRLPSGRRGRSRVRRLSRQSRPAWRDDRLRHRLLGRLSRRAPRRGAPISRASARPRPITAIRPPTPPICPTPRRPNCSTGFAAEDCDQREKPRCFGPRC